MCQETLGGCFLHDRPRASPQVSGSGTLDGVSHQPAQVSCCCRCAEFGEALRSWEDKSPRTWKSVSLRTWDLLPSMPPELRSQKQTPRETQPPSLPPRDASLTPLRAGTSWTLTGSLFSELLPHLLGNWHVCQGNFRGCCRRVLGFSCRRCWKSAQSLTFSLQVVMGVAF